MGKIEELELALEGEYPDGLSEEELNNLFWFEPEFIAECVNLHYNDAGKFVTNMPTYIECGNPGDLILDLPEPDIEM